MAIEAGLAALPMPCYSTRVSEVRACGSDTSADGVGENGCDAAHAVLILMQEMRREEMQWFARRKWRGVRIA